MFSAFSRSVSGKPKVPVAAPATGDGSRGNSSGSESSEPPSPRSIPRNSPETPPGIVVDHEISHLCLRQNFKESSVAISEIAVSSPPKEYSLGNRRGSRSLRKIVLDDHNSLKSNKSDVSLRSAVAALNAGGPTQINIDRNNEVAPEASVAEDSSPVDGVDSDQTAPTSSSSGGAEGKLGANSTGGGNRVRSEGHTPTSTPPPASPRLGPQNSQDTARAETAKSCSSFEYWYSWMWNSKKAPPAASQQDTLQKPSIGSLQGPSQEVPLEPSQDLVEPPHESRSQKRKRHDERPEETTITREPESSKRSGKEIEQPKQELASTGKSNRWSWYSMFASSSAGSVSKDADMPETSFAEHEHSYVQESSDNGNGSNEEGSSNTGSWALWFGSKGKSGGDGELAVSGTESQDHPQKVTEKEEKELEEEISLPERPSQPSRVRRPSRPNIVAPDINECFPIYSSGEMLRSSLQKIKDYITPSRPGSPHKTQVHEHLYRSPPHRIRKAVVIGVHGFFPTKMIRSILGEPTGTSVKFANEAAASVERWAQEKGYDIDIEKIALEGEGKVLDRVDKLYELLHNWIDSIIQADFLFFAAHSQGTPVAVHLMARLVEEGYVENTRIALLGMAGISLGPIAGLDQKLVMRAYASIESVSLQELFEFQRVDSFQSRKYLDSLRTIIAHNAKIVFVGSINDQLVPLYSSTCIHVSHPNIYRAIYVDGHEVVAPEFISTLVSLALRLRNIGSTDHGVVRELSGSLAGALRSNGHSKIYDEPRVYDMLLRHALETTDASKYCPVRYDASFKVPRGANSNNPYVLPWSMRGLVAEAISRGEQFTDHLAELYKEYEEWKPDSKVLSDVKYRLGAIQAKL
ncbi:hypothetical protein TRVA0_006S02674 [Trichomonascus vanleenenianus]|uniref:uncharacterized protein n=1 Tax=Trichomonascus vanleenenianus TaxID=2268995 RepID=UPI003ECB7B21